jgi:glycosyltransferase involved in cell wall biosynthesis
MYEELSMTDPLVSIVTPVYNGEKYLKNCIQGVLKQRYGNFEYIILDNASTDGTAEIIKEFADKDDRIKVFRNPETLKIIDNWNESLKYVSKDARWVKFAFADDILFPHCVPEMVRVGEKDPNIGFVSAYHLNGKIVANVGLPMDKQIADGKQMLRMHIMRKMHVCLDCPNTVMYRKTVMDQLNGFDSTYFLADTELAFRILNKYDLGFVHQVLSWTGVNEDRGATYAIYYGLMTKEYLKFTYKDIDNYDIAPFSDDEKIHVAEHYADEIARYVSAHIVHFLFKYMYILWSEAPAIVKKRMFAVVKKKWHIYLRLFLGSIIHYKKRAQARPTFKK